MSQPLPTPGREPVTEQVIADLRARTEEGVRTYGRPLETHNGRSAKLDRYQELLDAAQYAKQDLLEEADLLRVLQPVALWLTETIKAKHAEHEGPVPNDRILFRSNDADLTIGQARAFVLAVEELEGNGI